MQDIEHLSCNNCKQSNCFINKYCSQEWKVFLGNHKSAISYKKKQNIFIEGEMVSGVFFICQGKIKIYNTGKKGKQNIVRLADSGEMLGLRAFVEETYLMSASTLEDSSLCFFTKEIFTKTLLENSKFSWHLIELYAHQLSMIEIRHKNANSLSAKGKLAEALLMLKSKYGVAIAEKDVSIDVVLSRSDIAALAGISTEETIRLLTVFCNENILKKEKFKIIISDQDKLSALILENCCPMDKQKTVSDCLPSYIILNYANA